MWFDEKPEMVQVHFALGPKGLKDQINLNGHGNKWIMFHDLPDITLGPLKLKTKFLKKRQVYQKKILKVVAND